MQYFRNFIFFVLLIVSQSKEECKDLDYKYLDEIFSDYLTIYRNYEEKIFQKAESFHISNHYNEMKNNEESSYIRADLFDKSQCDIVLKNRQIFCIIFV
jgi:hypothetical protein